MRSLVLLLTLCVAAASRYGGCPPGVTEVACFINPCEEPNAGCYNIPGALCRPYYCGGCLRRWYVYGREVTRRCRPG